ncbi:MAG: hypothetical protein OSB70_03660 [Myxococcota bacterium]|nr:hypothetical protein [Myxococcota bacterium]
MKPPLPKQRVRKQLGKLVAVLALSCLAPESAPALETRAVSGPVEIRVELSPDQPVIGDPITLRIEAIAEPDVEILMPAFGEALDRFRIVDFVPRESLTEDGKTLHSQRYTLQAPASGEHLLPPILLEFIDHRPGHPAAPDELDAYEILTESIPFAIESMVPDSASADLSPPMEKLDPIGSDRTAWEWLAAAAFVLGLAGFFGFRAWQRWSLNAAVRSAWDMANSELEMLLASPLPRGERVNEFFVDLSGIVRRYLENRFSLRSPELTTERFLEEVIASPELGAEHQVLLKDFLNQCDLVKFAHHVPSPEAIRETTQKAKRFIDETREFDEDESGSRDEVAA